MPLTLIFAWIISFYSNEADSMFEKPFSLKFSASSWHCNAFVAKLVTVVCCWFNDGDSLTMLVTNNNIRNPQHSKLVINIIRLQHSSPTSMYPYKTFIGYPGKLGAWRTVRTGANTCSVDPAQHRGLILTFIDIERKNISRKFYQELRTQLIFIRISWIKRIWFARRGHLYRNK